MPHANPVEVERYLKGVNYPAKKNNLIKHAQQNGASQNILETFKDLREENFNSPVDVSKAVGEIDRQQKRP